MKSRKRVEIARTGTFKLSTGEHTFTKEQLAAAVRNAAKRLPRIGIGHTDPRWKAAAEQDGDPALGVVDNLTLEEDGDLLVGDFEQMPDWFADALPHRFPARSLEGSCDGDDLVITHVKALGTTMPGINTLEDLRSFVSDEGPQLVAAGADNEGHQITVFLAASGAQAPDDQSTQEVVRVDPKKEMRKALGLPEDATDEQVKAKFAEQFEPAVDAGDRVENAAEEATDDEASSDAEDTVAEENAEATETVEEPVTVAASVWNEREKRLAKVEHELAERRQAEDKARRDLKASAALTKGCITKAEEPGIRSWLDDNEDAATKFLDSLKPGRVPVDAARGRGDDVAASAESDLLAATRRQLGIKTPTEA
jgi:hypothetical protein